MSLSGNYRPMEALSLILRILRYVIENESIDTLSSIPGVPVPDC